MRKKWIRRALVTAFLVAGLWGAGPNAAHADQGCMRITAWQPVGTRGVCVPLV